MVNGLRISFVDHACTGVDSHFHCACLLGLVRSNIQTITGHITGQLHICVNNKLLLIFLSILFYLGAAGLLISHMKSVVKAFYVLD